MRKFNFSTSPGNCTYLRTAEWYIHAHNNYTVSNWLYPNACNWAHCDTSLRYHIYNILKSCNNVYFRNTWKQHVQFCTVNCMSHTTTCRKTGHHIGNIWFQRYGRFFRSITWIIQTCYYHRGIAFPILTITLAVSRITLSGTFKFCILTIDIREKFRCFIVYLKKANWHN